MAKFSCFALSMELSIYLLDVNVARHPGATAAIPGDAPWPDVKLCYLAVHLTNQSSSAYLSRISNDASIISASS